jgi:glycerol uptake facilitator-like aquaporin
MPAARQPSTSAKILYRPVGIVSSIAGGLIASMLFKQIWKRVSRGEKADPPTPLQSEYAFKEILLAALLQGAIFAAVKAVIQRQGAKGFERVTGEWPGS